MKTIFMITVELRGENGETQIVEITIQGLINILYEIWYEGERYVYTNPDQTPVDTIEDPRSGKFGTITRRLRYIPKSWQEN